MTSVRGYGLAVGLVLAAAALAACGGGAQASAEPRAAAAPQGKYAIKLDRQTPVGRTRTLQSTQEQTNDVEVKAAGQVIDKKGEGWRARLSASGEVTASNNEGRVTGARYVIDEFSYEARGGSPESVAVGTVVSYLDEREPKHLLEGPALSDQALKVLTGLLSIGDSVDKDDRAFGSKEPRAVGDSWPVGSEMMAAELQKEGMAIEADKIAGEVKLVGVETVGGVECLLLTANFTAADFSMPKLPPGAGLESTDLSVQFEGAFPVDTSKGRMREKAVFRSQIVMSQMVKGQQIFIDVTTVRTEETLYGDK